MTSELELEQSAYQPGREEIGPDEMRVIALGTGQPSVNRAQANIGWLVELGNGDKFMFDFGYCSQANFSALATPYTDIRAYFASHLHTDHVGDFGLIWVSGWNLGRSEPMRLYGPIGEKPEFGIKHFADRQIESFAWDRSTREAVMPPNGAKVDVTEIDYSQVGEVYNENGVKISSFPALHGDGSISYRLEWNDLVLIYSGDTAPNQFMIDNARGADIFIHETFNPPQQLSEAFSLPEKAAEFIATFLHSIPDQAGYVAEQCNPRLFVGFHCYNNDQTHAEIVKGVRKHYSGEFILARDLMVFNVTKTVLKARMTSVDENAYPASNVKRTPPSPEAKKKLTEMSPWLAQSRVLPPES